MGGQLEGLGHLLRLKWSHLDEIVNFRPWIYSI